MSNARNLARLVVDSGGDVDVSSLGNANDASALTTGTLPAARIPYVAGKNKIINGNFDIWQRGTSITSSSVNEYSADRFRTEGYPLSTVISRQAFSAGQTDVPGFPTYFCRVQTSAVAAGQFWAFQQRIEAPANLAGYETVTISFWVKAASTTIPANTFSYGIRNDRVNNPEITTTWQKITRTQTITNGAGSGYVTLYLIYLPASAAAITLDIAQVQVEVGSTASDFSPAGGGQYGHEMALCQRYYYIESHTNTGSWNGFATGVSWGGAGVVYKNHPVKMRAAPSITSSVNTTFARHLPNIAVDNGDASQNGGTPSHIDMTDTGFGIVAYFQNSRTNCQAMILLPAPSNTAWISANAEL